MLLFRSEVELKSWCMQRGVQRGELLSLEQTWELAKRWYSNRLDPNYRGRSLDQAQQIFRDVGLSAPFWFIQK